MNCVTNTPIQTISLRIHNLHFTITRWRVSSSLPHRLGEEEKLHHSIQSLPHPHPLQSGATRNPPLFYAIHLPPAHAFLPTTAVHSRMSRWSRHLHNSGSPQCRCMNGSWKPRIFHPPSSNHHNPLFPSCTHFLLLDGQFAGLAEPKRWESASIPSESSPLRIWVAQ